MEAEATPSTIVLWTLGGIRAADESATLTQCEYQHRNHRRPSLGHTINDDLYNLTLLLQLGLWKHAVGVLAVW